MAIPDTAVTFVVAAALLDETGRVLLQRRPTGKALAGLWEFPGGKIEAGEVPEAALARELHEELGIDVSEDAMTPACFATAPVGERHLLLLLFLVEHWSGTPRALEAEELAWAEPSEMPAFAMPPADLPLIGPLDAMIRLRASCPMVIDWAGSAPRPSSKSDS